MSRTSWMRWRISCTAGRHTGGAAVDIEIKSRPGGLEKGWLLGA